MASMMKCWSFEGAVSVPSGPVWFPEGKLGGVTSMAIPELVKEQDGGAGVERVLLAPSMCAVG